MLLAAAGALAARLIVWAAACPPEGPRGLPEGGPGLPGRSCPLSADCIDTISSAASLPMGMASQSTEKSRDLAWVSLALARAFLYKVGWYRNTCDIAFRAARTPPCAAAREMMVRSPSSLRINNSKHSMAAPSPHSWMACLNPAQTSRAASHSSASRSML